MEKLNPKTDGASVDLTRDNIKTLKELFPEIVTEGKVDFDALREIMGDEIDERSERYSLKSMNVPNGTALRGTVKALHDGSHRLLRAAHSDHALRRV